MVLPFQTLPIIFSELPRNHERGLGTRNIDVHTEKVVPTMKYGDINPA